MPLHVALFGRQHWGREPEHPEPSSHGVCCVVFGEDNILHINSRGRHHAFRSQVAGAIGVQSRFLRIISSQPRVLDAALDGIPCRSVVAVCEEVPFTSEAEKCILLDARGLFLGWRCCPAPQGAISCRAIVDALRAELGNGWRLWLRGVPFDADILTVRDGQVFSVTVLYARDTPVQAQPRFAIDSVLANAARDATGAALVTDGGGADHTDAAPSHPSTAPDSSHQDQTQSHHADPQHLAGGVDPAGTGDGGPVYINVPFLLLGQNYVQEWISVRLAIGTSVVDALNAAAAARCPTRAVRLPILCAVHPQPCSTVALTVCLPVWGHEGAIVAIDSRAINGRLFAVQIIGQCCRQDFLRLAGVPDETPAEVHFRDLPWALPEDNPVLPINGDLVLLRPANADLHFVSSLADMLQSDIGWATRPVQAENLSDIAWVLGPEGSSALRVPAHRQSRARREIAQSIGRRQSEAAITPAFGGIADFEHLGVIIRNVVVAQPLPSVAEARRGWTHVCLLDLRPLLLEFDWVSCSEGIFITDRILQRFRHRCPPGHCLGRIIHGAVFQPLIEPFLVQEGEVVVLAFRRDPDGHRVPTASPEGPTDDLDGHDQGGNRESSYAPNAPNADTPAESERSPSTDRDDNNSSGQSSRIDTCRYANGPNASKTFDMWTLGNSAGSPHGGNLWYTTVSIGAWWACLLPLYGVYAFAGSTVGRLGSEFTVFLGLFELGLAALNSLGPNRLFWLVCLTVLAGQCVAAVPYDIPCDAAKDVHSDLGIYHILDAHRADWQFAGGGGRPIPTPCRIRPSQHNLAEESLPKFEDTAVEIEGPLHTLLELSGEARSGHAFFLAHTLLDTLIEHFAESCCVRPSALTLSEYLPSCIQYDIDPVMLRIGKNFDDVVPFLRGRWPLQTSFPIGLQLHPATAKALNLASCNYDFDPVGIEVYTDVSFNGHISAWAFAVVELGCGSRRLRGWWRGSVALKGDDDYIGAESHSAMEAERTALFWAIVWTLSHEAGSIKIWTDSISVIGQTSGKWGGTASSTLARGCRAIAQAAETARDVCFSAFCHVRAHQGDPYNELVDVLAKGHQLSCPAVPAPHNGIAGWVQDNTIEWIWLLCDAMRNPGQWPALNGPCLTDSVRGHGQNVLDPRQALGLKPTAPKVQAPSQPLGVHLNVQTLEEDTAKGLAGRVPYVREQLEWLGVCLTGLQETRAKTTETVVSDTHYRFLSAGDHKGCLGVELWVSRRVPFATQGQLHLYFALEDFRVLSWSPRHLITKCVCQGQSTVYHRGLPCPHCHRSR